MLPLRVARVRGVKTAKLGCFLGSEKREVEGWEMEVGKEIRDILKSA